MLLLLLLSLLSSSLFIIIIIIMIIIIIILQNWRFDLCLTQFKITFFFSMFSENVIFCCITQIEGTKMKDFEIIC